MNVDATRASPNVTPRAGGRAPDILILHYTGMRTAEAALARLCDPAAEVSAHYVVDEDGRVLRLVEERDRAHHAGVSFWKGERDVNSASIGVEIVNPGHEFGYRPFPDAQVEAVIALCRDILGRWPIPPERVLAHSDVAPARKRDPGELFPWDRLAAAGVGHLVVPAPVEPGPSFGPGSEGPPVRAIQALFAHYGYGIELTGVYDAQTAAVVTAFQRHFRPSLVDGIADRSTLDTLRRLAAGLASG